MTVIFEYYDIKEIVFQEKSPVDGSFAFAIRDKDQNKRILLRLSLDQVARLNGATIEALERSKEG